MSGRLIAMVGPSGVGKDTVMDALCQARGDLHRVKRVITRPSAAGGEDFFGVDLPEFQGRKERGDFVLSWGAHDLHYGVPREVLDVLDSGQDALVNLSRAVLQQAARTFDRFQVIWLTAAPEVLARRLAARGRESADDIAKRLAREGAHLPEGVSITLIRNDRPLDETLAEIEALYFPERV